MILSLNLYYLDLNVNVFLSQTVTIHLPNVVLFVCLFHLIFSVLHCRQQLLTGLETVQHVLGFGICLSQLPSFLSTRLCCAEPLM